MRYADKYLLFRDKKMSFADKYFLFRDKKMISAYSKTISSSAEMTFSS